jgi:anti-sigma factor RsiW
MNRTHTTDDLLNEYLDNALTQTQRSEIEGHLRECDECSTRVNELRALFDEIESLPEAKLEHDLSKAIAAAANRRVTFAPLLWLIFAAQAIIALVAFAVAGWLTLPLIQQTVDMNGIVAQSIETLTVEWANWISESQLALEQTLQTLTQPLPFEASMLMIALLVAAVSLLWIAGNGLLITSLARRRA